MSISGGDFWAFSLERYSRSGVAELCLAMQDRALIDVCLLLFCIWCGQEGVSLSSTDVRRLDGEGAGKWNSEVVSRLRAARRAMKTPPGHLRGDDAERLRTTLKQVELEAERLEQIALVEAAAVLGLFDALRVDAEDRREMARANAFAYVSMVADETVYSTMLGELIERIVREP